MFNWLFGKSREVEAIESFQYGDSLTLHWNSDCEGWTASLPDLGDMAQIYIAPHEGSDTPQPQSCALIIQATRQIQSLNDAALTYLITHRSEFVNSVYKHQLHRGSFTPTGIEIFEHQESPGKYSLTYDPAFDSGAIWRVHFSNHQPIGCGFDD